MKPFWSKNPAIKKALLIHPFGIGDALFVTPLIRTLKENGIEQIDLLLGSRTREIFQYNPNICQIFEWDKSKPKNFQEKIKRWAYLVRLFCKIWNEHYPVVFDFSPTGQYAPISLFCFWIPTRVGFNFKQKGFFLTHKVDLPNGFSNQPMAEYYLDLVRLAGFEPKSRKAEFFLSQNEKHSTEALLQKFKINSQIPIAAIAPGGGESWGQDARLKRWPVQNFAALIRKFFEQRGVAGTILILGSKNEWNLGNELTQQLREYAVSNLCGETSISETAHLLKKSSFLIANDSGLVHLAHALDVPVVSIFGPVDPQVYGPYPKTQTSVAVTNEGPACRPCYQRFRYQASCVGVECLNHLAPEYVYQQVEASGFFNAVKSEILK